MSTWEQLDAYLAELTRRLGGIDYLFSDGGKLKLSPPDDQDPLVMTRFELASDTVRAIFGHDCLRTGHWKRHLHHQPDNWFVAEPVVSAYHLVVLFDADYITDSWQSHALDRARPVLEAIIAGLPPLDGGRRSAEMVKEP